MTHAYERWRQAWLDEGARLKIHEMDRTTHRKKFLMEMNAILLGDQTRRSPYCYPA
jgi:type II secretory pathway component PulM